MNLIFLYLNSNNWKQTFLVYLFILCSVASTYSQQCPGVAIVNNPNLSNFQLIFEDEFDYSDIEDLKKIWKTNEGKTHTTWYNETLEHYTEDNISFGNSSVILKAEKRDVSNPYPGVWGPYSRDLPYNSAMLQYDNAGHSDCACNRKISGNTDYDAFRGFSYGYYEAKIKIPKKHSVYPAFWLLSGVNTEIDIMEFGGEWLGTQYKTETGQGMIDWSNPPYDNGKPETANFFNIPNIDCWHIWGLLWTEDQVTFYMDGIETLTVPSSQIQTKPCAASIILNLAVRPGAVFDEQQMEIDYVRVYKDKTRKNVITATDNYVNKVHEGDLIVNSGAELLLDGRNALEVDYLFDIQAGGSVDLLTNSSYGGICPQKPYVYSYIQGTTVPDETMWSPKNEFRIEGNFNMLDASSYYVAPGATHFVKPGGVINMGPNSTITVRKGGKLVVEFGGLIKSVTGSVNIVVEEGATIENHGLIELADNTELKIQGKGGLVIFDGGDMSFGNNTVLNLEGSGRGYDLLRLEAGVYLHLDANNTFINDCKIQLKSNSTIVLNSVKEQVGIAGDYVFNNVLVAPNHEQLNNAIRGYRMNDLLITNCDFRNMDVGLDIENHQGELMVEDCFFGYSNTGLRINNSYSTDLILKNTILEENLNGAFVSNLYSVTFDNCRFNSSVNNGILTSEVKFLYLENGTEIHSGINGIEAAYSHIFLRGASKIRNNAVGINGIGEYDSPQTPMMISMGDDGSCGWITENRIGITGENIYLNIDAEDNRPAGVLIPVPNHFEGNGIVAEFCYDAVFGIPANLTIQAKGNFFGETGQGATSTTRGANGGALLPAFIVNPYCSSSIGGKVNVNQTRMCREMLSDGDFCDICKNVSMYNPIGGPNEPVKGGNAITVLSNCGAILNDGISMQEKFKTGYAEFINKNYDAALPMLEEVATVKFRDLPNNEKLSPKCEKMILIAEILTNKFNDKDVVSLISSGTSLYELNATPNPLRGNLIVKYNLAGKNNGQIVIKNAITGDVKITESIAANKNSKQIDATSLVQGNYILELYGEGQFLKSEHLMVY